MGRHHRGTELVEVAAMDPQHPHHSKITVIGDTEHVMEMDYDEEFHLQSPLDLPLSAEELALRAQEKDYSTIFAGFPRFVVLVLFTGFLFAVPLALIYGWHMWTTVDCYPIVLNARVASPLQAQECPIKYSMFAASWIWTAPHLEIAAWAFFVLPGNKKFHQHCSMFFAAFWPVVMFLYHSYPTQGTVGDTSRGAVILLMFATELVSAVVISILAGRDLGIGRANGMRLVLLPYGANVFIRLMFIFLLLDFFTASAVNQLLVRLIIMPAMLEIAFLLFRVAALILSMQRLDYDKDSLWMFIAFPVLFVAFVGRVLIVAANDLYTQVLLTAGVSLLEITMRLTHTRRDWMATRALLYLRPGLRSNPANPPRTRYLRRDDQNQDDMSSDEEEELAMDSDSEDRMTHISHMSQMSQEEKERRRRERSQQQQSSKQKKKKKKNGSVEQEQPQQDKQKEDKEEFGEALQSQRSFTTPPSYAYYVRSPFARQKLIFEMRPQIIVLEMIAEHVSIVVCPVLVNMISYAWGGTAQNMDAVLASIAMQVVFELLTDLFCCTLEIKQQQIAIFDVRFIQWPSMNGKEAWRTLRMIWVIMLIFGTVSLGVFAFWYTWFASGGIA